MGSGKGKTRRVGAAATRADLVVFEQSLWQDFVSDSGLGDTPLAQYYLGRNVRRYKGSEFERVLNELFADAVAVGAITLPPSYRAEYFIFAVEEKDKFPKDECDYYTTVLSRNGAKVPKQLRTYLGNLNIPLGSELVDVVLKEMASSAVRLLVG